MRENEGQAVGKREGVKPFVAFKLSMLRGRQRVALHPPFGVAATLFWRLETLNRPDQEGV